MSAGTINTMVKAVQRSRGRYALAAVGKSRRKAAARIEPSPLTHEARVRNYANQSGWTTDFTPAQRRRLKHKDGHLLANPVIRGARPSHTAVDEVTA